MKPAVTRALQLLRDADPAHNLAPVESATVASAWSEVREANLADPLQLTESHRPRRALQIVLVVATVSVVAGVSAAIVASRHSSTQPPGPGSSVGPTGTATASADPNFALTLQLVERILAAAPTLPGAVPAGQAPTTALSTPANSPADGNLTARTAFWTAPGTMSAAIAYFKANPPTGMKLTGTMTGGNANGNTGTGTVDEQGVTFEGPSTTTSQSPQLEITVVPLGGGVGVRVDAMAIWIPTKPASEHIGTVTSVDITVDRRASAPTVRRILTGAPAQRLADAVDALPVGTTSVRFCALDRGFSDDLVFHAGARTIHVVNRVGGCGGVRVTVGRAAQPELSGSVDPLVTKELALPANYGN
jgi:hypothetical protein